jgi:hypothetical protein
MAVARAAPTILRAVGLVPVDPQCDSFYPQITRFSQIE